jgi:hypothetical protein
MSELNALIVGLPIVIDEQTRLKSHPKLGSLARVRATLSLPGNPQFLALREKTREAGCARPG